MSIPEKLFDFVDELAFADLGKPWSEACSLYSNAALRQLAAAVIYQNDRGLEYLKTAPVLIIGLLPQPKSYGSDLRRIGGYRRASEFAQVAKMFRNRVDPGPKLRDLMAGYRLAKPLRAISGKALSPNKARVLHLMTKFVKPSVIAQAIPEHSFRQHLWLYAVDDWIRRLMILQTEDELSRLLTWSTANLNRFTQQEQARVSADLADFAFRRRERFDEKWTFDQAFEAMQRWHVELGRMNQAEKFVQNFGRSYDERVTFSKLPNDPAEFGGFVFLPLNSGVKLYEEGRAMRHCLASYTGPVLQGKYAAYSIRDIRDRRIATFGLRLENGWWLSDQIKGHCNKQVSRDAAAAAESFMVFYRKSRGAK